MSRRKKYIGIDLHHDNFFACFLDNYDLNTIEKFNLTPEGIDEFRLKLTKRDTIALESTTNTAFFIEKMQPYVSDIIPIHPYSFRVIATSSKKTDKHDAFQLAYFLKKDMLPKARIKPFAQTQVLSLISTRQLFVKYRIALNRKTYGILIRHGHKVPKQKLEYKLG